MKKSILFILLIGNFALGQDFFQNNTNQEEESSFYNPGAQPSEPEQGTEQGGTPGEPVPINNWLFLLPLAGAMIGVYYVSRKKEFI